MSNIVTIRVRVRANVTAAEFANVLKGAGVLNPTVVAPTIGSFRVGGKDVKVKEAAARAALREAGMLTRGRPACFTFDNRVKMVDAVRPAKTRKASAAA